MMEIINAAAKHEHHGDCCSDAHQETTNPAINHGDFSEVEDELKAAQRMTKIPSEVPEISVNGVEITEQQVLAEMQYHPAETKRQSMVKAAESLIIAELINQKALSNGLISETAEDESESEFELLTRIIASECEVPQASEQECQRFYRQNQEKFTTSPLLEVRHILLTASREDVSERIQVRDFAQAMIETLTNNPQRFDELVVGHSACPSKAMKGNLGQISQGQTVPEFERQIFKAELGLIPYPIETRYGFHIAVIDRKINGRQLPYDYVKEKVAEYLNEKVQRKNIAQYIQQLIQTAEIVGFNFDYQSSPLMQ